MKEKANILISQEGATIIDLDKALEANREKIQHFFSFAKPQGDKLVKK